MKHLFGILFSTICFFVLPAFLGIRTLNVDKMKATLEEATKVWDSKSLVTEEVEAPEDTLPELLTQEQIDPEIEIPGVDLTREYREWMPPAYSKQEAALGYDQDTFKVSENFRHRVNFWKRIYSQVTTDQGLLHDTEDLRIVYGVIDFREINSNSALSEGQKQRARRDLLKVQKQEISDRLLRISQAKEAKELQGEDLRYFQMFSHNDGQNKFREAASLKRIRFQLGQADRFLMGMYFSGKYLPEIESIFRAEGLPLELTRLPFVESSFNIYARSKVGASGIWQFIRSTGRIYLKMDTIVDFRNDPIEASRAAAKKLKSNYKLLGSWPLALTAYNHGPAGVKRIVDKLKTQSIEEIIQNATARRFGFASQNFYSCFVAALEIEEAADKFFKKPKWAPEMKYAEIRLKRPLHFKHLIAFFGENEDLALQYNLYFQQAVRRGHRPIPAGYSIRLPPELVQVAMEQLDFLPAPQANKGESSRVGLGGIYLVESGDTLGALARKFGVSVRGIMDVNELASPRMLRVGQQLVIPGLGAD